METTGKLAWAMYIDNELRSVFVEMANKVTDQHAVGSSSVYKPEITAFIDIIYFSLSYFVKSQQTPGMMIFNLEQNPESVERNPLYIITYIAYCWALQRAKYTAMMQDWRNSRNERRRKAHKLIQIFDTITKILTLANTLKFLYSGYYPSLMYRVMNCQMVNKKQSLDKDEASLLIPGLSAIQVSVKYRQIFIAILTATLSAGARAINWRVLIRNGRLLATNTLNTTSKVLTETITSTVHQVTKLYQHTSNQSKLILRTILRLALRHRPWLQRFLHVWYPSLLLFTTNSSPSTSAVAPSPINNNENSSNSNNNTSEIMNNQSFSSLLFTTAPQPADNPVASVKNYICGLCKSSSPEMPYIARKCQHLFCYLCIIPTILLANKIQQQEQQSHHQSQIQNNSVNSVESNSNDNSVNSAESNSNDNSDRNNNNNNNNNNSSSSLYNLFQFQDTSSIRSSDDDDDDKNVVDDQRDDANNASQLTFQCPLCRLQQLTTDCVPYYNHHHVHS